MEQLSGSILSVVTAAVIVGILGSVCPQKAGTGALIRMICGLFLAIQVISCVTELDFGIIAAFSDQFGQSADDAVFAGEGMATDAWSGIIKEETEAYILDKAAAYGASLEVEVTVSREDLPVPESVRIRGSISPYARGRLQQMMEDELGIKRENQLWIG